ncbi:MAG: sulfotransferase, partial [Gammaproteobacteria bacterium]
FQYNAINQSILDAKPAIAGQRWHEVFYEDLVRDPVGQFRSMFTACGLGFDERLERHCENVLNLPYNAFSAIRVDKWKDGCNKDRIRRVLPKLEKVATLMGYDC